MYKIDLLAASLLSFLATIFINISPLNEMSIRIIYAILIIFLIPGYCFIALLFPRRSDLKEIERFILSVVFSIVITVFTGILLSITGWLLRPTSLSIALMIITILFSLGAYISRMKVSERERYGFPIEKIKLIFKDEEENNENIQDEENQNSGILPVHKFKTKQSRIIPKRRIIIKEKIELVPPIIEKTLIAALILSILIASAMFTYAKITHEEEKFTVLYILGTGGKADNYTLNVSIGKPATYIIGIENYEKEDMNYTLQVRLNGDVLNEINVPVKNNEKVLKNITYVPQQMKISRSELEFVLFKNNADKVPYRSVHLWVYHGYSMSDLKSTLENISLKVVPSLVNGDMESTDGWTFASSDSNVTGSYTNGTGWLASKSFTLKSSYSGRAPMDVDMYHGISQNIESQQNGSALISLYIKDNFDKNVSKADETQFKQILVDGSVVWEDGIGGKEEWQHVQVPITLHSGANNISIFLKQNAQSQLVPVEVNIDMVKIQPLSEMSQYVGIDGTVESFLPNSTVIVPAGSRNPEFEVRWKGNDTGSGIATYDIEYSTNNKDWIVWLKNTELTSSTFKGEIGNTYYFRSTAYDKAGNVEAPKQTYDAKIVLDTKAPTVNLDISPNPSSGYTKLTVTSSKELSSVNCTVTPEFFKQAASAVSMSSTDGITWTGTYLIKLDGNHTVEIRAKDLALNEVTVLGVIYADKKLDEMKVEIDPNPVSIGSVYIRVTPSEALKQNPTIYIRDNDDKKLKYDGPTYEDGVYEFEAEVNNSLKEGSARVNITAYRMDSTKLLKGARFTIDYTSPVISAISPENGANLNTTIPDISAKFSDAITSVDLSQVSLKLNGKVVTSSAQISSKSITYTPPALNSGANHVELTLKDTAGNSITKTWTFYWS